MSVRNDEFFFFENECLWVIGVRGIMKMLKGFRVMNLRCFVCTLCEKIRLDPDFYRNLRKNFDEDDTFVDSMITFYTKF